MCRGIEEKVGSLKNETYEDLVKKFPAHIEKLKSNPDSICHYCTASQVTWKMYILNSMRWVANLVGFPVGDEYK
jgi:hypothetical protein